MFGKKDFCNKIRFMLTTINWKLSKLVNIDLKLRAASSIILELEPPMLLKQTPSFLGI